ncbi:MAG: polyprenyl synthetase family protein [Treponema sp.]|jgi:octaprenyl-diphosphate synthase|nr:polyprenyl synthetase family protein [Treponema sp.]
MSLDYTLRLQKIEAVLRNALPRHPDTAWFKRNFFAGGFNFTETDSIESLLEPGLDLLERGGKRWRPLLMLLICESLGGGESALPLAPLVEFCHNASLIHDDIEDKADERRGKPAIHLLYGMDTAINSGCFLYFLPLSCIDGWNAPQETKLKLYSLWAREMRALHFGQSLDIAWHRDPQALPAINDYYKMCALKTGVLARFAASVGYLAAAENCSGDAPFAKAAEKLGIGFQILDDVKNLTEGAPGKKRGDDVVEGKKSLPILLYLHGESEKYERRRLVLRCFNTAASGGDEADAAVDELTAALNKAGCIDEAAARGIALLAEAEAAFSAAVSAGGENNEACELLAGFTRLIGGEPKPLT